MAHPDESQVNQRLEEAYMAVWEASKSRGEVGHLVDQLNQALEDLEAGADPDLVASRFDVVLLLAEEEETRGAEERRALVAVISAQVTLTGVLVYATWRHLPRLFWRKWLNVKGGWLVENADR